MIIVTASFFIAKEVMYIKSKQQSLLLSILAGKWLFSAVFVGLFFSLHLQFSQPFLQMDHLELGLLADSGNLIARLPAG